MKTKFLFKNGFTLVEIMIVVLCISLVMGSAFTLLRAGRRTSLSGMMRIDTTLEARRVIRQLHADLKTAAFIPQHNSFFSIDDIVRESGASPENTYSFLSFHSHTSVADLISSTDNRSHTYRNLSQVTYSVRPNPNPDIPSLKLIREVRSPSGNTRRVLTERVNYFEIKPVMIQIQGRNQFYFLVTLQLIDSLDQLQSHSPGSRIDEQTMSNVILADFFDIVYPEFYHSMWNHGLIVPNWHVRFKGPD